MDIIMHINDTYVSVYVMCIRESNKIYDLLECVEYFVRPEIDQPQGVVPDTAQQVIAIWNTNVIDIRIIRRSTLYYAVLDIKQIIIIVVMIRIRTTITIQLFAL